MPEKMVGFAPVAGGQLHYEVTKSPLPDAIPIVFIHAGVADLHMWDAQIEALSPRCVIVRYDTRNYGKTEITDPDIPYSNRQDLRDLLDQLGIQKAIVAGCSRGGQIAIDFALESPERVLGLVHICGGLGGFEYGAAMTERELAAENEMMALYEKLQTATGAERDSLAEALAKLQADFWAKGPYRPDDEEMPPDVYDYVYQICLKQATRPVVGTVITLDPPAINRLNEITVPTLLVFGEYDGKETLAVEQHLEKHIADSRLIVIKKSAHLPSFEQPAAFNATLIEFLDRIVL